MVEANPAQPAAAEQEGFSLARMTTLGQQCSANGDAIPVDEFCSLLESIVQLLQGMGSMMSMAFSGKFASFKSRPNTLFCSNRCR